MVLIETNTIFTFQNKIYSPRKSSSYRASLRQVIEKRIGLETFTDKLTQVTKSESYVRAIKKPDLNYRQPSEVVFDFEFTRLFKAQEREYCTMLCYRLKTFFMTYLTFY